MFIKNFDQLATSEGRKVVLEMIEAGLLAIQPEQVMSSQLTVNSSQLEIAGSRFDLNKFERVFLLGFGKGATGISRLIEGKLEGKIQSGWVIDTETSADKLRDPSTSPPAGGFVQDDKIKYFVGTHPLPSEQNVEFTKNVVAELEGKLTEKDLVLVVICGGGSALFTLPNCSIVRLLEMNNMLLKSGAKINEMNTVRKKLDRVKGGGLAKILFPATSISLIFSDVPGNDLSVIASGPTVLDPTTVEDARKVLEKFDQLGKLEIESGDLEETPKEEKFFQNAHNFLMLSNLTAIQAMGRRAQELGYQVTVHSDRLQGEAREVGTKLIKLASELGKHQIILAGGETTVTVCGNGKGGRNQELVLGALMEISDASVVGVGQLEQMRPHSGRDLSGLDFNLQGIVIASFDSDGWDNSFYAGAIADENLKFKIRNLKLNVDEYLKNNDAFSFFEKTGDGIETGRLPCNVSDLMIVLKD